MRAEEISRPLDQLTRGQQLANTGRCLLEVEGDVPRARTFLRDAGQIAAALGQNFVELDWGRSLLARWDGDLAKAQESMRRALTLARLREDRWREMECLVWMVKISIERDETGAVGACVTRSTRLRRALATARRRSRTRCAPSRACLAKQAALIHNYGKRLPRYAGLMTRRSLPMSSTR